MSKRKRPSEIDAVIEAWVCKVISSRESLLKVELTRKAKEAKIFLPYLVKQTGLLDSSLLIRESKLLPVLDAMREEKIIVPGQSSAACEWRRRLLEWYERKSEEEKRLIPIFGNSIKIKGYLQNVDGLESITAARRNYKLVAETYAEIEDDLQRLGLIRSDYKKVKERHRSGLAEKELTLQAKLEALRKISIGEVSDVAFPDEPFKHVLHLFGFATLKCDTHSSRSNYTVGFQFFREYLISNGATGYEAITNLLTVNSLPRYRAFLQEEIIERNVSSSHANTMMSTARSVMKKIISIKGFGLGSFIDAPGFSVERETEIYSPYTPSERARISEAIISEINSTNLLARPYSPKNVGEDPVDDGGRLKRGYGTLDNARWIFENKFECVPVLYGNFDRSNSHQRAFLSIIKRLGLPLREVYRDWGVLWRVDARVLAPYVARLAQVTGLNADSLASLEIDDFIQSHDLTGRPCLLYWKERSDGQKMYHLDLFHAEIAWLTTSQGREVKKIYDDVIFLTREIRSFAPESEKNKLFIFQSSSCARFGEIKSIENSAHNMLIRMLSAFARDHALKDDDGKPLALTPSRLRPSFVSELVEFGVSIREIQVMLGHKNIRTTLSYLDRMQFNRVAREKLNHALASIHKKTLVEEEVASDNISMRRDDEAIIYRTGLASCRNPLNPPEFIKKIRSYNNNSACSQFNKCLLCGNSIVTVSHLPELFALRREYRHMLEVSSVLDTPYGTVILENLDVLNSILSSELSDFSESELEMGEQLSRSIITSIFVEGVTP